jgi:hypothetical protein
MANMLPATGVTCERRGRVVMSRRGSLWSGVFGVLGQPPQETERRNGIDLVALHDNTFGSADVVA